MFDAIVVGGRVAGASTALLLARKGFSTYVSGFCLKLA